MWWLFNLSIGSLLHLRTRLWLGRLLFRPLSGDRLTRVSWHRVIKGPCRPTEVEAMQYVAAHTTVPVPKLFAVHIDDGEIYIEMAYITGTTLEGGWDGLSTDQKSVIFAELKQHVSSLRELSPPVEGMVSSALQNPAWDARVGHNLFGPVSLNEFHSVVRGHLVMEDVAQYLGEGVVRMHTAPYRICFTHADLAARNIMIRNGHIAAIIDWDFAGWYPEYWEFTKAQYTELGGGSREFVFDALPCYEAELEAERILWDRLPTMGSTYTAHRHGVVIKHAGSAPSKAWMEARRSCQQVDLWAVYLARHPYSVS
ncbi:hypothetical protein E4U42_007032 [Claviceps africana]|uniref:non-specific serine/threonine protein kinase n=1 Tax=Claviceps africana TaxID=83212 RepID=A0A8K0JBJ0_9HYPO|nr:hypothetical protein E4U42_007032 [Claviceps africana]